MSYSFSEVFIEDPEQITEYQQQTKKDTTIKKLAWTKDCLYENNIVWENQQETSMSCTKNIKGAQKLLFKATKYITIILRAPEVLYVNVTCITQELIYSGTKTIIFCECM